MAVMIILVTLVLTCFVILYRRLTNNYDRFHKAGIPGPKPVPLWGNVWKIWTKVLPEMDVADMKKYGLVYGKFEGKLPILFVLRPDLIKQIFVKDFDHFVNRRMFRTNNQVLNKMISIMVDEEWRDTRHAITPTFTTGKIKRMNATMKMCCERLVENLAKEAETEGQIHLKDMFGAYTMDVIALSAFGLQIDTTDPNNTFQKNARLFFEMPISKSWLAMIPFIFPNMSQLASFIFNLDNTIKFFKDVVDVAVKARKESTKKGNDFLQMMLDVMEDESAKSHGIITEDVFAAQAIGFLVAGYDTTASTLASTFYHLAKNPHIQERLYSEIGGKLEQYHEFAHDMINDMPYLEMVLAESLRMHPPVIRIERKCNKDIDLNGIKVYSGELVSVPAYAVHHCEEFYPDPEKFDPERFSPENKEARDPFTYIPFGQGPRNCIGSRFALEEAKLAICYAVNKFRFFPNERTPEKPQYDSGLVFVAHPMNLVVGVEKRQ